MTIETTMSIPMDDEPNAIEEERDAWRRQDQFIDGKEIDPESYPRMTNISASLMFKARLRPLDPAPTGGWWVVTGGGINSLHLTSSRPIRSFMVSVVPA